jgi:hypothetical protein
MIKTFSAFAVFAALLLASTGAVGGSPAQSGGRSHVEKTRILIQLSQSPRSQYGKVPYEKQSRPQQVFSALWGLESEVNNGGFAQWFENSAGEMAVDTESALRTIGAHHAAAIVAKAVAAFPGGAPPRDHEARQRLLRTASQEIRSTWARLDQEFFKYPDDLTSLLYAWVKAYPGEFGDIR